MKTKLLLVTSFLLVGLVLAGCTNQTEEEKEPASDYSGTPAEEQEQNNEEDSELSITSILDRAESLDSSKYDVVTTLASGEQQQVAVWWKEDKMRAETTIDMGGQEVNGVYLLDTGEQRSYAYMPAQNRAVSMDYSTTKEEVGDNPKSQSSEIQSKDFEVVGEEVWDGKDCVVVEYTSDDGNVTKAWIWKEYGLPVRFVNNTPEGEVVTEIRNIDFSDIDDDKFELPEGVQVIDLPSGLGY